MDRTQQLQQWLAQVVDQPFTLTTASADASFRRYFRVHLPTGTLIAMDAPPPQEDCRPFVRVAEQLLAAGLNVPKIVAQDMTQGFLLLSDLGNDTYLSQLKRENAKVLYGDACQALIKMQLATQPNALPPYDSALLMRELQLFPEWYIAKHLGKTLTAEQQAVMDKTFALLLDNILHQPQVTVHRDYHSRNLMVTSENNPGILDFQDAVIGAITYDLVSLFKDAYIRWDEEDLMDWVVRYWQSAKKAGLPVNEDFGEFYKDFEWMGVQRHIKVLGIFARLYHRDGKDGYLKDMPLVMQYLQAACERYVELRPFLKLLRTLENGA
ncbi:aminoglycoside phosphotransferase family protein [Methylophilus sp. TWE2]|uniref:aminoglycoside phosphotransferase family protein n=1 Tax=Methylophilus sp. TWE2 TaxID=1662285 RepID=UPI0006716939|nr:phosphotransferase [Methylophilus sp. TWE2]AKR43744.1 aminoglycoside phosphotransferase [Methylophilus sp. TWE2]